MTINQLQAEMIVAMKQGNKFKKNVISGLIAQIKKAAIDAGCRDNITEEFVNKEILKAKKQAQESIDGAVAANRENLIEEYTHQYEVICSYAPKLIDNVDEIYAREVVDGQLAEIKSFISYDYIKEMDYIDKKINNYYSLYSTRILMVLSNNVNMQTYLNDLLMTIKDFEPDKKREIIESIAKCFSLRSYKYVGRKSIERRKKRKPNTKTGAIITGSLSDEEKARLTRELLYEYPDRYGVKQATSYFESVLEDKESIVPDKTTIKTREDAMMIAASIIYSGSLEFPYEVEFLEGTIETEVATISNIRIKRKL